MARAIRSGVMNDLGSGSNIDLCIITKDGAQYLRNHEFLQVRCSHVVVDCMFLRYMSQIMRDEMCPSAHAWRRSLPLQHANCKPGGAAPLCGPDALMQILPGRHPPARPAADQDVHAQVPRQVPARLHA